VDAVFIGRAMRSFRDYSLKRLKSLLHTFQVSPKRWALIFHKLLSK